MKPTKILCTHVKLKAVNFQTGQVLSTCVKNGSGGTFEMLFAAVTFTNAPGTDLLESFQGRKGHISVQ